MIKPPKPIESILVNGIVSPSKDLALHTKINLTDEERSYLESEKRYFDAIHKEENKND